MRDGSDGGFKVKVYKDQGSSFIRCHNITSNYEFIHILHGTISDGIFRERYASGNTAIGSRYFLRSGKEEDREYRLCRDNKSGNIEYHDQIYGKDHIELAVYRFNPETLEWTKLEV